VDNCGLQPPGSPDLAPSDFWFRGHLNNSLVRRTPDGLNELLFGITSVLGCRRSDRSW
jgi:hypothetical protein